MVLEQRLGFVATTRQDGTPSLSPKGTTTVRDDERLMFADIASPGTVANLRENQAIEINVVDPIIRKGYRFRGRAQLHEEGPEYEACLHLMAKHGLQVDHDRVRTVVVVEVEAAEPLISPVYMSGTNEEEVAALWSQRIFARLSGLEPKSGEADC